MAKYKSRLSKESFPEYLKLGLGLNITKDVIHGVVKEEQNNFHRYILQEIQGKQPCSECHIENILECPTNGFCTPNQCSFHSSSSKQPRQCPKGSCNIFRDRIRETFRFYDSNLLEPSWSNTDSQNWVKDAFQLTKCFLPSGGYNDAKALEDVDLAGLLHVVINNKRFEKGIIDDLDKNDNTCKKAINIEKSYRSYDSMTLSDWQLSSHLDELSILLTVIEPLVHDQGFKKDVAKLKQLKSNALIVNVQTIIDIVSELIQSMIKEDKQKTSQRRKSKFGRPQRNTAVKKLRLNILHGCRDIFSRENRKIKTCQLESIISEQGDAIRQLKEAIQKVQELDDKKAETYRKRSKLEKKDPTMYISFSEKTYEEIKSELKSELAEFYRKRHGTLPLSPLIQKNKAPLLDFYVQPALSVVDQEKGLFDRKQHLMYKDVNDLKDVFPMTNEKPCINICLTAPPGAGKTTFIKYLALAWSQTQNKEHHFVSKDEAYMQRFDFVFIIPLRDAKQECEQDEMIKSIVCSQLDQHYLYTDDFLQELLHKERCLVLMDGLDEWRHPKKVIKYCQKGKSDFPHTKVRLKCITLSTSRPWTLNNICDSFDHRLDIQGLKKESSKQLVRKVLCHLSRQNNNHKEQEGKRDRFFDMLSSKHLQNFESNPIILMQLLCLWFEGKESDVGVSQCEIYSNMLELLFHRADITKKIKTKGKHKTKLPNCFTRNTTCKRYANILLSLGKLAFATLLGENGESWYVFDRSIAKELMDDQYIQCCLEVGILSQNENHEKMATENVKLSFLHKTFQEFFAALNISAKPAIMKKVAKQITDSKEPIQASLRLDVLLIFVSGFAPKVTSEFTTQIGNAVANSSVTKEYRANIGTLFLESRCHVIEHCSMITMCLVETICNDHDELSTFYLEDICIDEQCMDTNYAAAMKRLIEMNYSHIRSLSIHVMQTVDNENVNSILHKLNIQSICNLEKLYVWGGISRVHLQSLLQLSKYTMKCLELWGMQLFSEDVVSISNMNMIESLSFLSTPMAHVVLEELMRSLNQRAQLSQLCLHDIECMDHLEACSGYPLNLSGQFRLELLLLDKVHLSRISFNGERLKMCVVEWLQIPGFLHSLLDCLSNAEAIERFDYDGFTSPEDTRYLVQTVSSMQNLKYLRLRNLNLDKVNLELERIQTLETVYFCNVSIEIDLLMKIFEQMECLPSSVIFCMDGYEVLPKGSYQKLRDYYKSSNAIKILLNEEDGFKQLHVETIPSDKTLSIVQTTDQEIMDWEQCFSDDTSLARTLAKRLIKGRTFPKQQTLDKLCNHFGLKDKLIKSLCAELSTHIQDQSEKIVKVIPSYKKVGSCKIIFVTCTKGTLSGKEKASIKYSLKIRPIGKYSSEGQYVVERKMLNEQMLSPKELENLKKIINKYAEILLSKHRSLSVIAPSPVRSRFYGSKTKKKQITREPCIVLYVHTKHFIPIDEEPFEEFYDGIPVDVIEGGFKAHPAVPVYGDNPQNPESLTIGCNIGCARSDYVGTLGGFIEHPTYGLCGLTCAHVLLNDQFMDDLLRNGCIKWPNFHPSENVTQPGRTSDVIGRLVQAVYSEGGGDQSGVEIALFQIERRHPTTGRFQGHADMRFNCGKSYGFSRISYVPVVKIGSASRKTDGRFSMNESAITVRTVNEIIDTEIHSIVLHNQLEVVPLAHGHYTQHNNFSEPGDSGSLVFMKRPEGNDSEYVCVGMVEGGTSYGTSIVTPICSILKACGVESFKNFETASLSEDLRNLGSLIMQELRDIRSRLPP